MTDRTVGSALAFFSKGFLQQIILHAQFRIHLLQTLVSISQILHLGNHRGVHPAKLGAPLAKTGAAHAVLTAKLGNKDATLRLLEDPHNLSVAKTSILHYKISSDILSRKFYAQTPLISGGITDRRRKVLIANRHRNVKHRKMRCFLRGVPGMALILEV
jgi:hypothetical protein